MIMQNKYEKSHNPVFLIFFDNGQICLSDQHQVNDQKGHYHQDCTTDNLIAQPGHIDQKTEKQGYGFFLS